MLNAVSGMQEDQDDTGVEISRYASLGSLGTMEEAMWS